MSVQAALQGGSRLAYVVVALQNDVQRYQTRWDKEKGLQQVLVSEPGGYMVYFPRGHALRIADKERLRFFHLDRPARLINLAGLNDPNSVIGRLLSQQDDKGRINSFRDLEKAVIQLATAKTGKNLLTADASTLETIDDLEGDNTLEEAA